jgi:hypothetical protein
MTNDFSTVIWEPFRAQGDETSPLPAPFGQLAVGYLAPLDSDLRPPARCCAPPSAPCGSCWRGSDVAPLDFGCSVPGSRPRHVLANVVTCPPYAPIPSTFSRTWLSRLVGTSSPFHPGTFLRTSLRPPIPPRNRGTVELPSVEPPTFLPEGRKCLTGSEILCAHRSISPSESIDSGNVIETRVIISSLRLRFPLPRLEYVP